MISSDKKQNLKYKDLVDEMTLSEKASLMSGANFWNTKSIERLGVPSIMLTDGPHGLRKQGGKADHLGLNKSIPATCFPTAATLANSWDIELLKEVGKGLGKEAAKENVSVILGPGLNIKRNPLCGRNFEYFSEDPYLTGKLSAAMIKGIQSIGVSACPKHFAVNSQETRRMIVDEIVDERALHELYLEGFRYAVKDGSPKTIMSSYNKINGTHANENKYLLQDVLKSNWEYDGLIVTDWGGNNNRVDGLIAGNALEMPSANGMTDTEIEKAVKTGEIPVSLLDERVNNLLTLVFDTQIKNNNKDEFSYKEQHEKAIESAAKSMVLLKNQDNILPLKDKEKKIAVIGDFAKNPRYQGAGSSLVEPYKLDNFMEYIMQSELKIIGYEKGFKRLGGKSEYLASKAEKLAGKSDIVILFLGLDEGSEAEGVDRKHMRLQNNQIELLNRISDINKNIILILAGGSPIEMPFINKVKAIVHGYLPGQGGGSAIAKIITGEYNPSGKLAESYPNLYTDVASSEYYPGEILTSEHRESIYIGYRHFDTANIDVLFPFGYGLSYTEFTYSDLQVSEGEVSLTVKNIGNNDGEEIVQIYIKPLDREIFHSEKELKGFVKVYLKSGESKRVTIELDEHAFAYYSTKKHKWIKGAGEYEMLAAASSRDIRLKKTLLIDAEKEELPYEKGSLPKYENYNGDVVLPEEFEKLLGRKLPNSQWDTSKKLDKDDIIEQGKYAGMFGKFLVWIILCLYKFFRQIGKPIIANNMMFAMGMPYRSVARMSGGKMNMDMLDGLLIMVNGKFFKGLYRIIVSIRK